MAVPLEIGGLPALTGALAILGGIAAVGQQMLHRLRVSDWPAHRLAVGSGITVAQVAPGDEMGSPLRPLRIGLNGLLTALLPLVLLWRG